jgi:hypothetical protein
MSFFGKALFVPEREGGARWFFLSFFPLKMKKQDFKILSL